MMPSLSYSQLQTSQTPRHQSQHSINPPCSPGSVFQDDSEVLLDPPPQPGHRRKQRDIFLRWPWKIGSPSQQTGLIVWIIAIAVLVWCGVIIAETWKEKPVCGFWEGLEEALDHEKVVLESGEGNVSGGSEPIATGHSHNSPATGTLSSVSAEILSEIPKDDIPRAVILHDPSPGGNNHHWTLYMPESLTYPLTPDAYRQLCHSAHLAAENVSELIHPDYQGGHSHSSYYHIDPTFLDPTTFSTNRPLAAGTCERTLTYYLTSPSPAHAGMGMSLMGLWLAYGLAQRENRTFFIDDTNWIWGNYSTYFQPPPVPNCSPPPKHLILPCPHFANHILVTPLTNSETFGHGFVDEFEVASAQNVFRQEEIFGLARRGYEDLFILSEKDEELVKVSVRGAWGIADEQFGVEMEGGGEGGGGRVYEGGMVVLHVRHGEAAKPREYWYSKGYLPLGRYVDVSVGLIGGEDGPNEKEEGGWGPVMLISDDPGIWNEEEMQGAWTAQVELPPWKFQAREVGGKVGSRSNMVEEAGITTTTKMFHESTESHSTEKRMTVEVQSLPGFSVEGFLELYMQERVKVGRGYLLDLKIAAEMASNPGEAGGGGVVCGGYSVSCRLLGVAMGWERGIVAGRWRDVDGWIWEGGEEGEKKFGSGGQWRGWVW